MSGSKTSRTLSLQAILLVSADLAVVFAFVGARHRQHQAQDLVRAELGSAGERIVVNASGSITEVSVRSHDSIAPGREFAHLAHLRRLDTLDLRGAAIDDAALADLAAIRQLRHLDLSQTPITDAGVRHLLSLTELQSLNLGGTRVTDISLRLLCSLGNLRVIHVENTLTTALGVEQFNHLAPDCVVLCDVRSAPTGSARVAAGSTVAKASKPTIAKQASSENQAPEPLMISLPAGAADRARELEQDLPAGRTETE
ncbi:MAG: hypothetical protein KDA42_10790 [Planctomycetales bacterium]|nr:hypothetical protein [Planctomycetales bacterium]